MMTLQIAPPAQPINSIPSQQTKKRGKLQLIYDDRVYNLKKRLETSLREAEEAEEERDVLVKKSREVD